ncbi:hypothetical protein ALNOE001_20190 [Candidatus Methanobinarius endosymbioticus]|uniref:Uncharacterized protein n=1 Tax=Candidatus Methanobinarius endosymbioticus TaxID=2006182 RepID=A0A366M9R6_9EURY|nr:hypothetical protein ALNOE001_20190 [Candidatus Methanobinarius endosymbioticus]
MGDNSIVLNSIFTDNNASTFDGGAIFNNGNNFTVNISSFTNNSALYGGAIYNVGGLFVVGNVWLVIMQQPLAL